MPHTKILLLTLSFIISSIAYSQNIHTIAGTGGTGLIGGDGGPATDAYIGNVSSVFVDNKENINLTDGYFVRKVDANSTAVPGLNQIQPDISISPNPTTGPFTLSLSSPTTLPAHIIITNIIGQKIKEFTTTTNKETEITLNAPPGIYFVTSVTKEGRQTTKLIIE